MRSCTVNDHQGKRWNVYGAKTGSEMLSEAQVFRFDKSNPWEHIFFFVEQKDVFS